jgi:hypothetical protein
MLIKDEKIVSIKKLKEVKLKANDLDSTIETVTDIKAEMTKELFQDQSLNDEVIPLTKRDLDLDCKIKTMNNKLNVHYCFTSNDVKGNALLIGVMYDGADNYINLQGQKMLKDDFLTLYNRIPVLYENTKSILQARLKEIIQQNEVMDTYINDYKIKVGKSPTKVEIQLHLFGEEKDDSVKLHSIKLNDFMWSNFHDKYVSYGVYTKISDDLTKFYLSFNGKEFFNELDVYSLYKNFGNLFDKFGK